MKTAQGRPKVGHKSAQSQARAAPKFGEGGGARGLVREPKDDAGDGVAIGGAGGG